MSLDYTFWAEGYEAFIIDGVMHQPKQCFEVKGEQKLIHSYIEELSKDGFLDTSFIYSISSGSNSNPSTGFTDAEVSLYFCTNDFLEISEAEFKEKYYTPYIGKCF